MKKYNIGVGFGFMRYLFKGIVARAVKRNLKHIREPHHHLRNIYSGLS